MGATAETWAIPRTHLAWFLDGRNGDAIDTLQPMRTISMRCRAPSWLLLSVLGVHAEAQTEAPPPAPPQLQLRTLWQFAADGQSIDHVAARAGFVFVALSGGTLVALRSDDGSEVWRRQLGKGSVAGVASVANGQLDAIVVPIGKQLALLDRRTGQPHWVRDMPAALHEPVVVGDVIVAGGDDGNLYGRKLATGEPMWATDYLADAPADPPGFSGRSARYGDQKARPGAATVDGDLVALSVFDQCRALLVDARTGKRSFSLPTQGWMFMRPTFAGRFLIVGSQDGHIRAFDKTTGAEAWSHRTKSRVEAAAVVRDGRVYQGSCDGSLYCLDLERGTVLWQQDVSEAGKRTAPIYEPVTIMGDVLLLPVLTGDIVALDRESGGIRGRYRPEADAEIDGSAWDGGLTIVKTRPTLDGKGQAAVFAVGR
jgi:outer membrane protein assembly factor BamB